MILSLLTALLFLSPDEATYTMRVLTYNIHHAEGADGRVDLDRIARVIEATKADVVCLQEVDRHLSRTGRVDMPKVLSEKLGMDYVFGANYLFDDGEYGNLTLSRFPIVESTNIALPNPDDKEPRGCLYTEILVKSSVPDEPDFSFLVYNTHLGLSPTEREAQAESIAASLKLSGAGCVVVGDMNEGSDNAGMQLLLGRLHDASAIFHARSDGAEPSGVPKSTFPAKNPRKRIDYVLCETADVSRFEIHDSEEARGASDHLPVVAELQVNVLQRASASGGRQR